MTRSEANRRLHALRLGYDMPRWQIDQCLQATGDLAGPPVKAPAQPPLVVLPSFLNRSTRVMREAA